MVFCSTDTVQNSGKHGQRHKDYLFTYGKEIMLLGLQAPLKPIIRETGVGNEDIKRKITVDFIKIKSLFLKSNRIQINFMTVDFSIIDLAFANLLDLIPMISNTDENVDPALVRIYERNAAIVNGE